MSTLNLDRKMPPPCPPDWTLDLGEEEYHAAAAAGRFVSSGMLKEFRLCPAHYRDLIAGAAARRDSDAFRLGRAVHKLILEGEAAFRAAYVVGGPLNDRTGRSFGPGSRAFDEWLRENCLDRRRVLTDAEAGDAYRMLAAVRAHPELARLFAEGWPERSVRADLAGLPCQTRLDWLRPDGTALDLKTTDDIGRFEADARRFGYLHQFAFQRGVARQAGGGDLAVLAAVVEKKPPHRAGLWRFSADVLEPYAVQNGEALAFLGRCRRENRWPTGYEAPRDFPLAGIPPVWLN